MQSRKFLEITWPFKKARCGVSLALGWLRVISSIHVLTLKPSISFKWNEVGLREQLGPAYPVTKCFLFLGCQHPAESSESWFQHTAQELDCWIGAARICTPLNTTFLLELMVIGLAVGLIAQAVTLLSHRNAFSRRNIHLFSTQSKSLHLKSS